MKVIIAGQKVFQVFLAPIHIKLLLECSAHHYDGKCKAAGRVGGFIYNWRNREDFHVEFMASEPNFGPFSVFGDFGEFDTCLKILEINSSLYNTLSQEDQSKRLACLDLHRHLRKMLTEANAITDWVKEIDV